MFSYVRADPPGHPGTGVVVLRRATRGPWGTPPHPECGIFNQMVLYLGGSPSPPVGPASLDLGDKSDFVQFCHFALFVLFCYFFIFSSFYVIVVFFLSFSYVRADPPGHPGTGVAVLRRATRGPWGTPPHPELSLIHI